MEFFYKASVTTLEPAPVFVIVSNSIALFLAHWCTRISVAENTLTFMGVFEKK